jgi:hypothetical protein
MRRAIIAVAAACLSTACTFDPGGWFATLSPTLTAAYVALPDRDAREGWQMLNNDYEVKVGRARLVLGPLRLLASPGVGKVGFDPGKPPPGYTLCHNGHCHNTDGRLVPYAEIEAELGGGGPSAGLQPVVTLAVAEPLDLLAPDERPLGCEPSCNLNRTTILRASALVTSLVVEGAVRDRRVPARLPAEAPFRWQVSSQADGGAPAPSLEAELNLPADRSHPPAVTLRLGVELTAAVFDGVEFGTLEATGGVLDAAAAPNPNLTEGSFLKTSVSRQDD